VRPIAGEEQTTRGVAIDWEGLERALLRRSRESEAFLDTRSGDVVYLTRGWSDDHAFSDQELDEGLAAQRLVPVLPVPPETEQHWMRHFVESLDDGWTRDMLLAALEQPAPDLRFEDALGFFPDDRLLWLACRNARMAAVIRAWLDANDIQPTNEPPLRYR
jgi:Uncharacterised protein family (UPF0158)